jgi:hypothetical protein
MGLGAHGFFIKPIKVELFRKRIEEFCCIGSEMSM